METLRIRVHLLGGQTLETVVESIEEPEDYARNLAASLTKMPRQFTALAEIAFHTNAIAGFDVDTYEVERKEQ